MEALPLMFAWMCQLVKAPDPAEKIVDVIDTMRTPVNTAVDKSIETVMKGGEAAMGKMKDGAMSVKERFGELLKLKKKVTIGGEQHTLRFKEEKEDAVLGINSTWTTLDDWIEAAYKEIENESVDHDYKKAAGNILEEIVELAKQVDAKKWVDPEGRRQGTGNPETRTASGGNQKQKSNDRTISQTRGKEIAELYGEIGKKLDEISVLLPVGGEANAAVPESEIDFTARKYGAGKMTATNLSIKGDGKSSGSEPRGDLTGIWSNVSKRHRFQFWVRGHLLNHHLFGPGKDNNLCLLSQDANKDMHDRVESDLKEKILNKNAVVDYVVVPHYNKNEAANNVVGSAENQLEGEEQAPLKLDITVAEKELKPNAQDGTDPASWAVKRSEDFEIYNTWPDEGTVTLFGNYAKGNAITEPDPEFYSSRKDRNVRDAVPARNRSGAKRKRTANRKYYNDQVENPSPFAPEEEQDRKRLNTHFGESGNQSQAPSSMDVEGQDDDEGSQTSMEVEA
ncbi:MAG: DNA/RNA non-specific endonuclease [Bacteroidota bacterium]